MSKKKVESYKRSKEEHKIANITRRDFIKRAAVGAVVVAGAGALAACEGAAKPVPVTVAPGPPETTWDYEADVVVIGAGAAGLPAAIKARDQGVSVILVEANYDIGGHAIISGGNTPLGGGTSAQQKFGIVDSPEIYFKDLTDWTVLETNGMPDYRYNDRDVAWARAYNSAPAYEFLVANGVIFRDTVPDNRGAHAVGLSATRENHTVYDGPIGYYSPTGSGGTELMRPLEESARAKGVQFLLNHHMDSLFRETPTSGRVLGVSASYTPRIIPGTNTRLESYRSQGNIDSTSDVNIKVRKGVIIATGGNTSNVNFRRMVDPRLTEEFQLGGEPYSYQDASGELAAMTIGAALGGAGYAAGERNGAVRKRNRIGTQHTYASFKPDSPMFPFAGGAGLNIGGSGWVNVIAVNQLGQRFHDEMGGNWAGGTHQGRTGIIPVPYVHGSIHNLKIEWKADSWLDAALAMNKGSTAPDWGAGPTWVIFDAAVVAQMDWNIGYPNTNPEFFFSGDTIAQLAQNIMANPYQKVPMPAANLEATVARFNSFVDTGVDEDFGREAEDMPVKIETPPFYAAWASPAVHDTYLGLRINAKSQVIDRWGEVIPGLYGGGESTASGSDHGLGRCICAGYIAGNHAALA